MKTTELIPQRTLADYENLVKQGIQYTEAIVAEFQQQGVFFDDILAEAEA